MTETITVEAVRNARVLVVGDVMLDRYWFGDVERISPEAPVPVVKVVRTEERLGGAANVAWNMAAIGARPVLLSVVGDDAEADSLQRQLDEHGIQAQLYRDANLSTTIKMRVIGRQQQLIRIDFENEPGHEALAAKLADFEEKLAECDVVIMSDYGKGGLKHIERMIGLTEGNIFQGELSLEQLAFLRPVAGWSRYKTPIDRLWMCGSGTHPGGGIMGAPGELSAKTILSKRAV